MKNILYIIAFLLPLSLFSQEEKVLVITDTTLADQWLTLANDWHYQKGDNLEWAKPEFDDSSWQIMTSVNLNMPDGKSITESNEIVWYRRPIKADSTFNDAFVFTVYQSGASEIYLDGVLVHKVGEISSNKDKAKAKFGGNNLYSLPLKRNKEHMLAVRFQNIQPDIRILHVYKGISINVHTCIKRLI